MKSRMNALVLDDEPRYRDHLKRSLEREDLTIHVAKGADEAKRVVLDHGVDLMIVDVKLANSIDGLEFADWAIKRHSDTVLIVITGYNCPDYEQRSRNLGAIAYLEKPFSLDELEIHVKRAIDQRNLLREVHRLEQELAEARDNSKTLELLSQLPLACLTFEGEIRYASPEGRRSLEAVTDQTLPKPLLQVDRSLLNRLKDALGEDGEPGQIPVFTRNETTLHYDAYVHRIEIGNEHGLVVFFAEADRDREQEIDDLWAGILTRAARAV